MSRLSNNSIELTGMVINVMPVGEYDKRLTIFTKERGKISAFARGAKRQGSALMGCSRIFAFGKFVLYEARDYYSLQNAQISNYFGDITEDIEKTCYGTYFLELLNYYGREAIRDVDSLKLIYMSLLALGKPAIPYRLTRRIFELRLMVINGEYDSLPDTLKTDTGRYTWGYIIRSPIEKLYTFQIKEEVLSDIESSLDIMMKKYIDRDMNSLDILNIISKKNY